MASAPASSSTSFAAAPRTGAMARQPWAADTAQWRRCGLWLDDVAEVRTRLLKVARHLASRPPEEAADLLDGWQAFLQPTHLGTIWQALGRADAAAIWLAWDQRPGRARRPAWMVLEAGIDPAQVVADRLAARQHTAGGGLRGLQRGIWLDCCA